MRRSKLFFSVFVLLLSTSFCVNQSKLQRPSPVEEGQRLYLGYCATCHGKTGKGEGSMTPFLTIVPTDLTTISARYGGTFPEEEIFRIIDGQKKVRGHGDSEMPVWGYAFEEMEESAERGKERIQQLVTYLKSIQE